MTIKEIKNVFKEYANLKVKGNLPDDYNVTEDDILNNKIFQKYIESDNITKIVCGLCIMDNEISYMFPSLKYLEIESDDLFPPCGGYIDLNTIAHYDIYYVTCTGKKGIFTSGETCYINAMMKVSNKEFTYSNHKLTKKTPNNTDEEITTRVEATYYYRGEKFTASKTISQYVNQHSSWLIESEPTDFITITLDKDTASHNGDFIGYKVERYFTRIFFMKDSCGNKIGGKSEPNHVEDITRKAIVSSTDRTNFRADKTGVFVSKQKIGAPSRSATITARYLEFEANAKLTQEPGGSIVYKDELSFDNGATNKFVDVETSLPININIPIISKRSKYIDGEYVSTVNNTNLKAISDGFWASGRVETVGDEVFINVDILEPNTDKENDREAEFLIIDKEDENLLIKLIISQPALIVSYEKYVANFYGFGEYSSREIDNNTFFFKTYKETKYENGDFKLEPVNEPFKFKVSSKSSDERLLSVSHVEKVDDKYVVHFTNYSRSSTMDIDVEVYLVFIKEDENITFKSEVGKITAKGNEIVNYAYELCFDDHQKYESVVWNGDKSTKHINLKSLRYMTINSFIKETTETPCDIQCIDEKGNEIFDNNFSIRQENGQLTIFPYKADRSVVRNYNIVQKESKYSVSLRLEYIKEPNKRTIPFKVIIKSNNVKEELWTNRDGYIVADDDLKISLAPCWLSPSMAEKSDVAYKGSIKLANGKHQFKTSGLMLSSSSSTKNVLFKKDIEVNDKTSEITIEIVV